MAKFVYPPITEIKLKNNEIYSEVVGLKEKILTAINENKIDFDKTYWPT